jgi:uncharacterized protein (TIGR02611 family)
MDATDEKPGSGESASAPEPLPVTNGSSLLRPIRKAIVFVLGMSVVLIGIVMIVAPGPAVVVIPAGLAILATEFVWARHLLNYAKRRIQKLTGSPAPPEKPLGM